MQTATTANAYRPKRGRPDARQAAAIEQAILSTARRMFLDGGYDAVAMENIATVTGVSKGTLYARYPSKEALFTAVIEECVRDWSQTSSQQDHLLTDDIGERLHHYGRTIARSLSQPEVHAFQRLLLASSDRFPELAMAMYETGYLYIVRLIGRDIGQAAERDGIPARDPEGVARLFVAAIAGWRWQEGGAGPVSEQEMLATADRTARLFMAARTAW